MPTGLDAELVAMPRAYDMHFAIVVGLRPDAPVGVNGLQDALQHSTLTNWPRLMRAAVVPRVELAIDFKNTNFELSADNDFAIVVSEAFDLANAVFRHSRHPWISRDQRAGF
jgi:hypothetical protein